MSAFHVLRAVDPDRYDIEAVGITREGAWVRADDAIAALSRRRRRLPARATAPSPPRGRRHRRRAAARRAPGRSATTSRSSCSRSSTAPGARTARCRGCSSWPTCPYVGAGVLGSALCMDKLMAKDVLAAHGLPQVPWIGLPRARRSDDARSPPTAIAGRSRFPLFVKPANMGSSVGVSQGADDATTLADAIALARSRYDEWIVVEEGVSGREIEVAVLGNADPRASVPGEIVPGARVLRLRGQVPRRRRRAAHPGRRCRTPRPTRCRRLAVEAFTALPLRRHGPGRLLLRGRTGAACSSTSSTPSRASRRSRCTRSCGQASGLPYDRAHRRAGPPGPRAPRAAQPLLDQALAAAGRHPGDHHGAARAEVPSGGDQVAPLAHVAATLVTACDPRLRGVPETPLVRLLDPRPAPEQTHSGHVPTSCRLNLAGDLVRRRTARGSRQEQHVPVCRWRSSIRAASTAATILLRTPSLSRIVWV